MKIFAIYSSKKVKFTKLLIDLILLFFLAPLTSYPLGYFIIAAGFLVTNITVINTLSLSKKWFYSLIILAILAFVFDLIYFQHFPIITQATSILAHLFYVIFMVIAILAIGSRIFTQTKVDIDIINGGICIFLLLGFLWYNLYNIILSIDPNALGGISLSSIGEKDFSILYYSFTTITTLGYGDIVPINKFLMTLANAEAIVGLMYPSIFIARLMSLYTTQEDNDPES